LLALIDAQSESIVNPSENAVFVALTTPLRSTIFPYTQSKAAGVPGAERALNSFLEILREWISVERWFCVGTSYADSVDSVRKAHKDDIETVLRICRAHEQLGITSYIVTRLMSAMGDGSRVDSETSNASPIGNRVSPVAGAASLSKSIPSISEIGAMGSSSAHSDVALRARKLLMQESMPSLEQRKHRVLDAAKRLTTADSAAADEILADHMPLLDVFFPLLGKALATKEEVGLLELNARRLYRTYTLKDIEKKYDERALKFSFLNKPAERVLSKLTSVSSMTELSRLLSRKSSLSKLGDPDDSTGPRSIIPGQDLETISPSTVRTGVWKIVESFEELSDPAKFEIVLKNFSQFSEGSVGGEGPVNVLYLVMVHEVVGGDETAQDSLAERFKAVLEPHHALLKRAQVRRVTFSLRRKQDDDFDEHGMRVIFTYRTPEYKEEPLIRSIDPSLSMHLELARVAENFRVRGLNVRHTPSCHIHLYEATPRASAIAKDKSANKAPRIFVRALSFSLEFSSSGFERILVNALNAIDLCSENRKSDNHLFVNLGSDFEKAVLDPVVVEQVVVDILKRHGDRVSALGIVEVETKIVCSLSMDSPPIALRLVASNPTGFVHVMNTYVEAADESGERVLRLIGGTKASLASAGDSSWEGLNVHTPYPLTRPFDAQRKAALKSSDTLYCYDLPALFEAAVEQQWVESSEKGGVEGGIRAAGRPLMVMYTTELVVKKKASQNPDSWTMKDYLNGELEVEHVNRGAGANDVGMVAWLMVLKTVEYPNVRIAYSSHLYFWDLNGG
jgi:acetyl-CoA carboxylase / biotin carboxylase 1